MWFRNKRKVRTVFLSGLPYSTIDHLLDESIYLVCGTTVDESVKNDIAMAQRLRITATTLDGILTVKGQGRGGEQRHE